MKHDHLTQTIHSFIHLTVAQTAIDRSSTNSNASDVQRTPGHMGQ